MTFKNLREFSSANLEFLRLLRLRLKTMVHDHIKTLTFYPMDMDRETPGMLSIMLCSLFYGFQKVFIVLMHGNLIKKDTKDNPPLLVILSQGAITTISIFLCSFFLGYYVSRVLKKSFSSYTSHVYVINQSFAYLPFVTICGYFVSWLKVVFYILLGVMQAKYICFCVKKSHVFNSYGEMTIFYFSLFIFLEIFSVGILFLIAAR